MAIRGAQREEVAIRGAQREPALPEVIKALKRRMRSESNPYGNRVAIRIAGWQLDGNSDARMANGWHSYGRHLEHEEATKDGEGHEVEGGDPPVGFHHRVHAVGPGVKKERLSSAGAGCRQR